MDTWVRGFSKGVLSSVILIVICVLLAKFITLMLVLTDFVREQKKIFKMLILSKIYHVLSL